MAGAGFSRSDPVASALDASSCIKESRSLHSADHRLRNDLLRLG